MRKIFLLAAALLFVCSVNAQNVRSYDWDADLEHLAREMPKRHYDFFTVKSEADFNSGIEKIKAEKGGLTDYEIALKVQQLIAGFGDSHSSLNLNPLIDKAMILPLDLFWFSDGLYILKTTVQNAAVLGHRIVSVNGIPLKTITDSLSTMVTMDNEAILKSSVPRLLPQVQTLRAFGFTESNDIELGLEDLNGNSSAYVISPEVVTEDSIRSVKADSLSFCEKNKNLLFTDHYFSPESIYYLQYNECWGREVEIKYGDKRKAKGMPSFKEFENRVLRTLSSKPADKIIFDVRYNDGGSSAQGTRFVERLANEYLSGNKHTKVYVVLGRSTFSSAILNAMDFDRLTDAVFVGEETAGKPNHFGEVLSFPLPASGLKVRYSSKYFKRTSREVNTLAPDVKMELSFSDYMKGIDPVYEWISRQ